MVSKEEALEIAKTYIRSNGRDPKDFIFHAYRDERLTMGPLLPKSKGWLISIQMAKDIGIDVVSYINISESDGSFYVQQGM